ncbi:carbohydrate ABC transporter substrate-binding protein (CUT1 family) [Variovorax sp. 54]|uniref:ABC transporter substrate-binding protein n=1 Tax=Variovorax sp. 54 TaxID=2035212 RepID=UPI000C17FCC6|nr:extracellular solute-binding protein [Variovorax sp. 54]PIF73814.1 carbohydrate ABC transporter substrate-binding protein (CUT1 family) [Variovorax sp. 54]
MLNRREFAAGVAASALAPLGPAAWAQGKSLTYVGFSQDEAASKPTLAAFFDTYRRENPDVKLEAIGFPWAQTQQNILLRVRANQPLHVAQMQERWLPTIAPLDRLVDLDTVFSKGQLEKLIDPGVLALGEFRGKRLGLPWTAGSIGMVGNLKVLQAAGVAKLPVSVDDFVDALRKVKKGNPQAVPYALMSKNNGSLNPEFQVWLWTFGGRILDDKGKVQVNDAAGVRALSFMTDLMREGLAARDIDRPDARRLFAQHQTAFYNDAPLARGFARNNSGQGVQIDSLVASVPTPVFKSDATPQSFAWGHLLGIFKSGSARIDAQSPQAKLLQLLALNDTTQLEYFKAVGLFPVTNTALEALAGDAYVHAWSRTARSARRDELAAWPNSADLTTIVGEEVQSALLQLKSPQQAIEAMAKRLDVKMAEVR